VKALGSALKVAATPVLGAASLLPLGDLPEKIITTPYKASSKLLDWHFNKHILP